MKARVKATGKVITVSDYGKKMHPRYWDKTTGYEAAEIEIIFTEEDLDALIDKAPAKKVRACLKEIATYWFKEEDDLPLNFDKELDSDALSVVTETLQARGFCPPQKGE